jgi:hypothetical protein
MSNRHNYGQKFTDILFEKRDKSENSIEMDLTEILSQGLEWIE